MDRTISINDAQEGCHYYLRFHVSDGEDLDEIVATWMPHSSYEYLDVTKTMGLYPLHAIKNITGFSKEN